MNKSKNNPDANLENGLSKDNKLNPIFNDLINPETFINHIEVLKKDNTNLFTVKSANDWINDAMKRPIPKMLFSEFWFEGEICILFADTNLGKSILAVQIGDSISKGTAIRGFKLESHKQQILYFDFELSDKQFENRYSENFMNHYKFNENFKRIELNPDADIPNNETFENHLNHSLENTIIKTNSKVLIIDNLTYLKNETEKAKNALPLMKLLKRLKSKYNLSILVLAHTPKRDLSKPITRNDLAGSKMLINFVDSCFSIGESNKDKSFRYFKQIKSRNTEILYDGENVIVSQIEKQSNFLQFEFVDFGSELEHLKQFTENDKEELEANILELKAQNPNLSLRQIAKQLETNPMKVKRTIERSEL